MIQPNVKRRRSEFIYIDVAAFPQLESDEPGVITIGGESADVGCPCLS